MIYIEALNEYIPDGEIVYLKKLFLAGGITSCPDWQQEIVELLKDTNIVIFNPRRKNFPTDDPNASYEQAKWEWKHFRETDMISFWFSKGSLNPIVLFELGKWLAQKEKPIFIGIDPEYKRKQDVEIQTILERPDLKIVYSLKVLADQIKAELKHMIYF